MSEPASRKSVPLSTIQLYDRGTHLQEAGPDIVLFFVKTGSYSITVEDFNEVIDLAFDDIRRPSSSAKIYVQEPLQEGSFLVSVEVHNPLGRISETLKRVFKVQLTPVGVSLNQNYYIVSQGDTVNIHASVEGGSNVSYNWIVDRGTHLREAGPDIVLSFVKTGSYSITVEAFNEVTDLAFDDIRRPSSSTKKMFLRDEFLTFYQHFSDSTEFSHCHFTRYALA